MNRMGLIGDVHAEDERLEAALRFLAGERVDRVLCVGDLSDGKGDLDRCVRLLRQHRVEVVRGNHDRWLVAGTMRELEDAQLGAELEGETRAYLEALPATLRLETGAGALHLCHGLGRDDMLVVRDARALEWELHGNGYAKAEVLARLGIDPDVRFLVGGHTHERLAARVDQFVVVNPGTLRRTDCPGFAILDVSGATIVARFFDLDDALQIFAAEEIRI